MATEDYQFFGGKGSIWGMLAGLLKRETLLIPNDGVPVNGTSGTGAARAGKGSLLLDYANGTVYVNTGTKASPTWTQLAASFGTIALAQGFMVRGSVTNTAESFDTNNAGQIIVGDGTTVASVAVSGDATLVSSGALTLGTVVTGAKVANTANVNVIGGIPVVHRISAVALTGNIDVILTNKTRILSVYCIKTTGAGGAGDTIQVLNGAAAITNAMDLNVADTTVVRVGTVDDANWDIAAAGTLRITGASAVDAEVIVEGIRVA